MTDSMILFEAVRDGVPVTVNLATESEIENIARPLNSGQDVLEFWSLIAFRFEDARCEIHALGWRRYLRTRAHVDHIAPRGRRFNRRRNSDSVREAVLAWRSRPAGA
jgi:hypothetical protein